jgi:hypothetical protein
MITRLEDEFQFRFYGFYKIRENVGFLFIPF